MIQRPALRLGAHCGGGGSSAHPAALELHWEALLPQDNRFLLTKGLSACASLLGTEPSGHVIPRHPPSDSSRSGLTTPSQALKTFISSSCRHFPCTALAWLRPWGAGAAPWPKPPCALPPQHYLKSSQLVAASWALATQALLLWVLVRLQMHRPGASMATTSQFGGGWSIPGWGACWLVCSGNLVPGAHSSQGSSRRLPWENSSSQVLCLQGTDPLMEASFPGLIPTGPLQHPLGMRVPSGFCETAPWCLVLGCGLSQKEGPHRRTMPLHSMSLPQGVCPHPAEGQQVVPHSASPLPQDWGLLGATCCVGRWLVGENGPALLPPIPYSPPGWASGWGWREVRCGDSQPGQYGAA